MHMMIFLVVLGSLLITNVFLLHFSCNSTEPTNTDKE
jgi:hypothetical protein